MDRQEAIQWLLYERDNIDTEGYCGTKENYARIMALNMAIEALKDRPQGEWNTHEVACLLADVFGDTCACNYNGIDEWLPSVCEFAETECPNPVGVACWEQYAKHRLADMRGGAE